MASATGITDKDVDNLTMQSPVKKDMQNTGLLGKISVGYKNWREKRYIESGAYKSPDDYMWFEDTYSPKNPNFKGKVASDYVDKGKLEDVVRAAHKVGIEPYLLAGVTMSETGVGKDESLNMGRVFFDAHPEVEKDRDNPEKNTYLKKIMESIPGVKNINDIPIGKLRRAQGLFMLDSSAQLLKESLEKHSNDLLTGMQEYSGSGSKAYGGRVHSAMFGKEYRDIDFHKDKDQGHRALEFANIFKDNPEFNKLIKETTSGASGLQTALQL